MDIEPRREYPGETSVSAQTGADLLLVDDDEDFAESLALLLRLHGHRVLIKANGPDALSAFEAGRFDLIMLDIRLPGMDGLTCFDRIRAVDPAARIVFITGMRDETATHRVNDGGAVAVFDKPVPLDRLFALLDNPP